MTTARIHIDDQGLKAPLAWSLALHSVLLASLAVSTLVSRSGENWSGTPGGGAISVKLVSGLAAAPAAPAGIPLPRPEVVTPSRVVDTTKGLYKSEPQPKPKAPPPDAKQIPEFTKEKQPRYVTRPSKLLEDNTPPPPNAVPYGQGGSPSVPYSQSQTPATSQAQSQFNLGGAATTGGFGFSGSGGGGDFASRFSWYVDAVRNRVSSNWLQSTVDPSVRFAPRAVVSFDVLRNGSVANVQILQSSGNASVDNSAVRAILGSNPLNPLPGEYGGSKVSVEFWFDFKR